MGLKRLLLLGFATSALLGAGVAHAGYRITGMDLYGHGVVTAAEPGAPAVGTPNYFHVWATFWPPFVGNPYPEIPIDATGTYNFMTIGGPWGFEVNVSDIGGWTGCEVCDAHFSLVNGQLTGPFTFDAGVDPVHYVSVSDTSFWAQTIGPDFSPRDYSGTFVLDSVTIHTDAPAPEPSTWLLMVAGLLGAGQALRMAKRTRSRSAEGELQASARVGA